ncbi:MAG: hypothetical protein WCC32_11125 [Terriglobales bacterium]
MFDLERWVINRLATSGLHSVSYLQPPFEKWSHGNGAHVSGCLRSLPLTFCLLLFGLLVCRLAQNLTRQPGLALRGFATGSILTLSPGAAVLYAGRGRPSSAVLAFEYGLPSPQRRPIRSLAGQSALLPASSLLFFPPIAAFVKPR